MRELSLHIMDIVENGLGAGATQMDIAVREDWKANRLLITVTDNGRGIPAEMLERVLDPFFTTKKTRRVGLGISLFQQLTKRCEGQFHIESKEGQGTRISGSFQMDHIDLPPLGDMAKSLTSLIMGHSEVDFVYTHDVDGDVFHLDTRQIKEEIEGVSIGHPEVLQSVCDLVHESLRELGAGNYGVKMRKESLWQK